ncbi:MAG: hypothetical protein KAJ10_16350, partial [Thermodesulfovibrionia bacterium]|nr:hypothetical protein [Thermodesulfovibrionia bacterium]
MALFEGLISREREEALKRLYVPLTARSEILNGINNSKTALGKLRGASQKEIYHSLQPLNIQTIIYTMAKASDMEQKKAVSLYLTTLRKIKPALSGKDLKSIGYSPGPVFKIILTSILEARLEGKIKSREEEVAFVKENFKVNSSNRSNI